MDTKTLALLDELENIYSEYYGEIKDRFQETIPRYNTHSVEELVDYFLDDLNAVDLIDTVDLTSIDLEAVLCHAVDFLKLTVPTDVIIREPQ